MSVCQSAYRPVPDHISRPDYADHPEGDMFTSIVICCIICYIKCIKHAVCWT